MTELDRIGQLDERLEKAIELVDRMINDDSSLRLRMPYCSVASIAIGDYLSDKGYATNLVQSRPRLPFEPTMRHVMVEVHNGEGETVIVDATYSQFLEYVGLTPGYVFYAGRDDYPPEKIAMFERSNGHKIASALTQAAVRFQSLNVHPDVGYGQTLGHGPLENASHDQILDAFGKIWDGKNFVSFSPTKETFKAGKSIGALLKDDSF